VAVLRQEEMLELAEKAVNCALKKGVDEVEAFVYRGLSTSVNIERGEIAGTSRVVDQGIGSRVIVKKSVGFSYTNMLENDVAIEETVSNALSFAKAGKPDKDWHSLPAAKSFPSVTGTYDHRIVELSSQDLIEAASKMLDAAEKTDKRAFAIEGGVGAAASCMAVANSKGVAVADHGTVMECSLATIGRDGTEVTPVCFEFDLERSCDIDPERVGGEAARMAVSALRAKSAGTTVADVIFTQFALQQLLHYTFVNAVNAEYVQRNQSPFKDKIGEEVASPELTIYDDGLLDGGIRTWKFDGEGVPQQKTLIVEKGTLRGFIYDNYAAKREGKGSTGNGARAAYLSTPSVDTTNLHILPSSKSAKQLMSEVDNGFLVHSVQGAHSSNPASGEFSVVATPCWRIENGEIAHAAKGVMIAGDIFHLLKNISGLADNERQIGQLVAPWVLAENVKVIGK
jgi:PmbA protein